MNFKDLARLKFRPMTDADRDVYTAITDQEALIAYTRDGTCIIEGDLLRIVRVNQKASKAVSSILS